LRHHFARATDDLARIADDRVWLAEGATIARNAAYALPIGAGLGPYTLTPAYTDIAHRRGRAALAGRRLAALINPNLR
jgi:hypothetical protein